MTKTIEEVLAMPLPRAPVWTSTGETEVKFRAGLIRGFLRANGVDASVRLPQRAGSQTVEVTLRYRVYKSDRDAIKRKVNALLVAAYPDLGIASNGQPEYFNVR